MEFLTTKLKHTSEVLMNNFHGTNVNYKPFPKFTSHEHKLETHKTLRVWPTKR